MAYAVSIDRKGVTFEKVEPSYRSTQKSKFIFGDTDRLADSLQSNVSSYRNRPSPDDNHPAAPYQSDVYKVDIISRNQRAIEIFVLTALTAFGALYFL